MTLLGLIGFSILPQRVPPDSFHSIADVFTSSAPIIDGVLSDSVWSSTGVADSFIQDESQTGRRSETRSQAYVLYDETHLYAAYRLEDALPPVAQLTRRDADLLNDDFVILFLDTDVELQLLDSDPNRVTRYF